MRDDFWGFKTDEFKDTMNDDFDDFFPGLKDNLNDVTNKNIHKEKEKLLKTKQFGNTVMELRKKGPIYNLYLFVNNEDKKQFPDFWNSSDTFDRKWEKGLKKDIKHIKKHAMEYEKIKYVINSLAQRFKFKKSSDVLYTCDNIPGIHLQYFGGGDMSIGDSIQASSKSLKNITDLWNLIEKILS